MKPILIFDLGKVILDFDHSSISKKLAALSGGDPAEIHSFLFASDMNNALDRGELTPEEFFSRLRLRFSLPIAFEQFSDIWNPIFSPYPGMEELIAQLSGAYRLGILSNTNALHFDYIMETFPVMRFFSDYHLSFKLGLLKPDPLIYKKVLGFYGGPSPAIVYVDDIREYAEAAKKAGLSAIHFRSAGQLRESLQEAGVCA